MLRSQATVNNLLTMNQTPEDSFVTKADQKAKFHEDVIAVKARIRSIGIRTLDPAGRFMRVWDMVVVFALTMTAVMTPFELAFFPAGLFAVGPFNFAANRLIDAIFVTDIGINFFLPFRAALNKGGMMIYDNKRIALNYFRGCEGSQAFERAIIPTLPLPSLPAIPLPPPLIPRVRGSTRCPWWQGFLWTWPLSFRLT